MLRVIIGFVVIAIFSVVLLIWGGVYNVAANDPHWSATESLLEIVRERSVESRSESLTPPESIPLDVMARAATDYEEMCSQCHLAPGREPTALNQGLYPRPPALHLEDDAEDIKEVFWIIKNGLKFTGMPAWGGVHSDMEIWALATFVGYLPEMSAEKYRELTGLSMHAAGASHRH